MVYEELVKRLIEDKSWLEHGCLETEFEIAGHIKHAADAIEELSLIAESNERSAARWAETAGKAIEQIPRWIPVTEQNHPKAYEPVIVVYIGWNDALPHRDCTAYWSEDEGLWRWAETNDKVKVPITHYMPLPEPPKEEK